MRMLMVFNKFIFIYSEIQLFFFTRTIMLFAGEMVVKNYLSPHSVMTEPNTVAAPLVYLLGYKQPLYKFLILTC